MTKNVSKSEGLPTATPDPDESGNASETSLSINRAFNTPSAATRAVAEALRPVRDLNETIKRLADPLPGLSDSIRKALINPLPEISALRIATDPFAGMPKTLRFSIDPWAGIPEATRKAILNPMAGLSETLREAANPFAGISEAVQRMAMGSNAIPHGVGKTLATLQLQNDVLAKAVAGPALKMFSLQNIVETWPDPFGVHFQAMALASRTLSDAIRRHEELRLKNSGAVIEPQSLLLDSLAVIEEETAHGFALETVKQVCSRLLALFMPRLERAASIFEQQRLMGVIAVLSFFLMFYFEAQGDAQHHEVMESLALLPAQIQTIENSRAAWEKYADEGGKALAVVMRRANLRPTPDTAGKRLALLHEAEVVEFLELSDGWAKVRYFDAVADVVMEGWVYAQLIRVMPRD